MDSKEFSVVQFFKDGKYEYVCRWVSIDDAVKAVKHFTTSVAVQMGMVERVIVTDGGDCICLEWVHGQGIVFPTNETVN